MSHRVEFSQEFRVVPRVAIVIAVLAFVGMQLLWHVLVPTQHDPPPFWLRLFLGTFLGGLLACLVLLIGYVNGDSKRRGMNSLLWTLLVIFIPNALGFVLYFFIRQPLRSTCHTAVRRSKWASTSAPSAAMFWRRPVRRAGGRFGRISPTARIAAPP